MRKKSTSKNQLQEGEKGLRRIGECRKYGGQVVLERGAANALTALRGKALKSGGSRQNV